MAEIALGLVGAAATVGASTVAAGSGFTGRHENSYRHEIMDIKRSMTDFLENLHRGDVTQHEEREFLAAREQAIQRANDYYESINCYKGASWIAPMKKFEKKRQVRGKKRSTQQSNHSLRSLNESMYAPFDASSVYASLGSPPGSNLAVDGIRNWASDVQEAAGRNSLKLADDNVTQALGPLGLSIMRFICPSCNQGFEDTLEYMTHLQEHLHTHTMFPFVCPWCSKRFSERDSIRQHVGRHMYAEGLEDNEEAEVEGEWSSGEEDEEDNEEDDEEYEEDDEEWYEEDEEEYEEDDEEDELAGQGRCAWGISSPLPSVTNAPLLPCPYRIGEKLGSEPYATLKVTTDIKTGKQYVCKVISKEATRGRAHLVQSEVTVLKRVRGNNLNIVKIHDCFETSKRVYLCLNLYTGGTLFDRICNNGTYSEAKAAEVMRTILIAVKHIHDSGIEHRGLNPKTLHFLSAAEDAPIVISGFGFSRMTEGMREAPDNAEMGIYGDHRPRYIAPEVFLQPSHSKPVDIWGVGLVAFFMIAGLTPFDRDSVQLETRAVVTGAYEFAPQDKWDNASFRARDFIRLCLTIASDQRPTAAKALTHQWLTPGLFSLRGILGATRRFCKQKH